MSSEVSQDLAKLREVKQEFDDQADRLKAVYPDVSKENAERAKAFMALACKILMGTKISDDKQVYKLNLTQNYNVQQLIESLMNSEKHQARTFVWDRDTEILTEISSKNTFKVSKCSSSTPQRKRSSTPSPLKVTKSPVNILKTSLERESTK